MYNSFDGKTYKRVGGHTGDRLPATGIKRTRAIYTAVGGETQITLSGLDPAITYFPGNAQLDVKRSSSSGLISGLGYFETSPTTISFPASSPLIAGEIVEITRSVEFIGILPAQVRPDGYTTVATAGQTLVSANFSWQLAALPTAGFGGAVVFLSGQMQTRGVDYTEVDLGTGNTNQITFLSALSGGENVNIIPTFYTLDNSAGANSLTSRQISDVQAYLTATTQAFVKADVIVVPYSVIQNRALARDPSLNLKPKLGVERMKVDAVELLQNELGPNNESVFKVKGDSSDRVRLYGAANPPGGILTEEEQTNAGESVDLPSGITIELFFYGTGVNLLLGAAPGVATSMKVDGTSQTSPAFNFTPAGIAGNAYGRYPVVSGLTQGPHTVTITLSGTTKLQGFEFIGGASLVVGAGRAMINGYSVQGTTNTAAYNTTFENVLDANIGVNGGRASIYLKSNSVTAKSLTLTDTQVIGTSASHVKEEIVSQHAYHEFSFGYASDLGSYDSLTASSNSKAAVLDDNSTGAYSKDSSVTSYAGTTGIQHNYAGTPETHIVFTGTGLDLHCSASNVTVDIDGTTFSLTATAGWQKIASGLPMGTHVAKITGGTAFTWSTFRVWAPKKTAAPASSVELADYNIMASTTRLKKSPWREARWSVMPTQVFSNAYAYGNVAALSSGSVEFTFWGTGIEIFANGAPATLLIDGAFPSSTTTSGGTTSNYNSSTGVATLGASPSNSVVISGLTLSVHTVRLTVSSAMNIASFDIIAPIYSQNTVYGADSAGLAPVWGTSGLRDRREFTPTALEPKAKNTVQAYYGGSATTSSGSYALVPGYAVPFYSKSGKVRISYDLRISAQAMVGVFLDGVNVSEHLQDASRAAGSILIDVPVGQHHVAVMFNNNGSGTITANGANTRSTLIVEDIHD